MILTPRTRFIVSWLAFFLVAYGVVWGLQAALDGARSELLAPGTQTARERLIELGATVMLGSFRTIAVNLLWYQAGELKERREHVELESVIRLIAKVQPTDIAAYTYQVWNMAYNVQYDAATASEAWKWVRRSLEFGMKGAERNRNHPQVWKLYAEIARVFSHRCADVGDARTRYFEKQVLREFGKSPYLVAAEWYQKAWEAATRPGVKKPHVHTLSMWAYAYSNYARRLEKQGRIEEMIRYRQKAIEIHEQIARRFPDAYRTYADKAVRELRTLIAIHRDQLRAARMTTVERPTPDEIRLRLRIVRSWRRLLEEDPRFEEAQRNLDRAADELGSLADRVRDPATRDALRRELLRARYAAADPRRRSSQAARRLVEALQPFDARLAALSPNDRRRMQQFADEIRLVSSAWVRVISNPLEAIPGESREEQTARRIARGRRAEAAIQRFDALLRYLPPKDRAGAMLEVTDHWVELIEWTGLDTPPGKRRVASVALAIQERTLLPLCRNIEQDLQRFGDPNIPASEREAIQRRVVARMGAETDTYARVARYWRALLRRNPAYAAEARQAEQNLIKTAQALDQVARAFGPLVPEERNVFATQARNLWRILRRYNPRNPLYAEKARRGRVRRVPSIHGHQH